MSQDETNQENSEQEYIPPGKRLITPADVVDLDPEMTVYYMHSIFKLGTLSYGNARLQSNSH